MEELSIMTCGSLFCLHVDNDFYTVHFAHQNMPPLIIASRFCVLPEATQEGNL
jgi:hypothetical protein